MKKVIIAIVGIVVFAALLNAVSKSVTEPSKPAATVATKPTATAVPVAKPTPTVKPTANPQIAITLAYAAEAQKTEALIAADSALPAACGNGDFAACRAALMTVVSTIDSYIARLDRVAVPTCLVIADHDLRIGFGQEKQGALQGIVGIDNRDAATITAGANMVFTAVDTITRATTEITSANCPK